jgi:hypothetical protein
MKGPVERSAGPFSFAQLQIWVRLSNEWRLKRLLLSRRPTLAELVEKART